MNKAKAHKLTSMDSPTSKHARQTTVTRLAIIIIILTAIAARLLPGPRTIDDAYITFRYARNLLEGHGFVYNPGERMLGTTTPLYTLLMAGLSLLTGSRDFPTLAIIVNALAGAAAAVLLYKLAEKLTGSSMPAAAAALLWAIAPYSVTFAVGGMETDLTIALLIAAAYAHITTRSYLMAMLSALALLARPDTVILLGLLWLDHGWENLRQRQPIPPLKDGLISLGILAPWIIFSTLYFGSPLTNSVAAKSVTYRLPPEAGSIRLLQHYATPFFEHLALPSMLVFGAFVLYLVLCAIGGLDAFHRNRRTWPIIVYPFAYFVVFAVANPLLFRWYLSPPVPFYFLLIFSGVWTLARRIKRRLANIVLTAFAIVATAFALNAWEIHPDHGPDRPAPEMAWFQLERLYARAANRVLSQAQPGDTLCAGDIGVLGYKTGMPIVDTVGLVTPETRQYYPANPDIYVTNYAIPADLVLALAPEYVVILEVYGRLGLLPNPDFQRHYQLLDKIETNIYGSDGMLIFKRQ